MDFAESIAQRSYDPTLKVGCVITSTDFRYVYGLGYNGNYVGGPNRRDSLKPGESQLLHSEINAIINCATPRHYKKYVFVTHVPCTMCSKALINMGGVEKVFYKNDYRDKKGLSLLRKCGIKVKKVK